MNLYRLHRAMIEYYATYGYMPEEIIITPQQWHELIAVGDSITNNIAMNTIQSETYSFMGVSLKIQALDTPTPTNVVGTQHPQPITIQGVTSCKSSS